MTAQEIVREVERLGVQLEVRGDRLHVEAPVGVLKPEHREALVELKTEVLAYISSRSAESRSNVSIAAWEDGSMRVRVSEFWGTKTDEHE